MELVEALAARRAVWFAKELNLSSVELEGDSSRVIKALNDLRKCNTHFGHVIDESMRVNASLRFCKFQHV